MQIEQGASAPTIPLAATVEEELWRRRQSHREHQLVQGLDPGDQLLVPLIMSLARLAAQRDVCRGGTGHDE